MPPALDPHAKNGRNERPDPAKLAEEDEAYRTAGEELSQLTKDLTFNIKIRTQLKKLISEVEFLKFHDQETTVKLTRALTQTHQLLIGKFSPIEYEATAKDIHGKSSSRMKIIGGIMLTLCALTVAFVAPPIGTAMAATFLLGGSACFFSGRRKGLSAAMHTIATDKQAEELANETPKSI